MAHKRMIDILFLDFKKAFDKVARIRLLLKCEAYGITGKLLKWIASLLSG